MTTDRRTFIKATGAAAVATGLNAVGKRKPCYARANVGTLETLRVGVVGFGGRGKQLIGAVNACNDAKLVALSDVDSDILNKQSTNDKTLFRSDDFRRLLDRDDIDVIVSATPNHWHSLLTVLAMQAGKHVYIEKPISHNMFESKTVVAAAEHFGKLVQCGFQNRSDTGLAGFFTKLSDGEFGAVQYVHGTCHRPRKSIGKLAHRLAIPKQIDYELWLGPASDKPITRPRLHYDWHWDFNTGNGDVGNQGPHEWDMINWALGDSPNLPESIRVAGNRFGWNDAGNTPNVMACAGIMDGIPFGFEVMDLQPGEKPPHGCGVGVIIETEKGRFVGGRGGGSFTTRDGMVESFSRNESQRKTDGTNAHLDNFVQAVLSNDRNLLRSDCKVAAKSSAMAHMANISYQLAPLTTTDDLNRSFNGDSHQTDMIDRLIRSTELYAKTSKIETIEPWKLGPELTFDNQKGTFTGDVSELANQKMTRDYRRQFSFPAIGAKALQPG